jgi:hypothetical protein
MMMMMIALLRPVQNTDVNAAQLEELILEN